MPLTVSRRLIFLPDYSADDALETAIRFLVEHSAEFGLEPMDLQNFVVTDRYTTEHNGLTHIYLRQTYNDLEIIDADININLLASGEVVNVGSSFLPGLTGTETSIAKIPGMRAERALSALAAQMELSSNIDLLKRAPGATIVQTSGSQAPNASSSMRIMDGGTLSKNGVLADLHYVPTVEGGIELAWRLNIETTDDLHWYDAKH